MSHHSFDSDADPFAATRHLPTPFLLLDLDATERNLRAVQFAFPGVEVWYALKCNADPRLVRRLVGLGIGFEVASPQEVRQLLAAGVPGSRMMCLHTIQSPAFLELLRTAHVAVVAFDAADQLEAIARHAPDSRVVVRVQVTDRGSRVPLGTKFGCTPDRAVELIASARRRGVRVAGVTMHVGSQCESVATWVEALAECRRVAELASGDEPLELVSLGGGLPVPYSPDVPDLEDIGKAIVAAGLPRGCRVTVEPGRAIAATAGTLVASVISTATRDGLPWLYLDAGIYHGLFEALPAAGGLTFPVVAERTGPTRLCRLAGPTCDSLDVLPGTFALPALRAGDRVAFRYAGAYSTAMATAFNGFDPPPTHPVTRTPANRLELLLEEGPSP